MEKLVYLLWKPVSVDESAWHRQLAGELVPRLRQEQAFRFRLNLADSDVAPAADMRMSHQPPLPEAIISFWLSSASQRQEVEVILKAFASRIAGYCVCESEPISPGGHPAAEGERRFGMNHVVFLQKPLELDRAQWLDLWLEQHTPVAIDTQQTFGYRQNVVLRRLQADAPELDAIVEENFPPEAMSDQNVFYRQDTPEQLGENQKRMYESCKRFIDFRRMGRLPTSEYNFR